ncbi:MULTISPECIES: hypothetical protein [unclassified Leucobacter]|uniref:hypothetical protein n=1 Tax=unclassified Leucobacter TaxID=2621730 RepID=UPI0006212935|nr:hypothetical protein [Leucobacter sp. Ag1]KKI20573.1 hypothetical protein XM48_07615 [Leucobacter sp. Ag1]
MTKRFKLPKNIHSCDGIVGSIGGADAAAAIGLWAIAGSWARKQDTGGYLDGRMLKHWRIPTGAVQVLVATGVLTPLKGESGQLTGDYQLTNWND